MADSNIGWTDKVWNPVVGCSRVSAGCERCYAEAFANRLEGMGQARYRGLTVIGKQGARWTGEVRTVSEVLGAPLHWRKGRRIFVNSMSDLFHDKVPFEYVAAVFGVMAACPQHTFQVLTKRPDRALAFFNWLARQAATANGADRPMPEAFAALAYAQRLCAERALTVETTAIGCRPWPLPNVHLGVSCEDQATADERIPILLQCPAAVRWISAEPLLGPLDLCGWGNAEPSVPGDEWRDVTWETYPWEDWIPVRIRELISDFWSAANGRGPSAWLRDHVVQRVPRTGARMTLALDDNGWLVTNKMATKGVTGRYVHLWNNIGRLVDDGGVIHPTAGGSGSGWLSRWMDRDGHYRPPLHWVVAGGESGADRRDCDPAWIDSIVAQCTQAGVPVFVKQDAAQKPGRQGRLSDATWALKEFPHVEASRG